MHYMENSRSDRSKKHTVVWWPNSAILAVWQFHSWVFECSSQQFGCSSVRQFHSWVFKCSTVWWPNSAILAVSLLGVRVFGSLGVGTTPGCSSVRQFYLAVSLLPLWGHFAFLLPVSLSFLSITSP